WMLTTTQQDGNLLQVWIFNYNDDHSREIYHTKSMQ
ncbi:hypothetical protein CFC21_016133, partial [Triticum aestivum]